jgi:hypothetical protein
MIEEKSSGWDVDRDPVTIGDACLSVSLAGRVVGMTAKATVKTKMNNDDGSMGRSKGGGTPRVPGTLDKLARDLEALEIMVVLDSGCVSCRSLFRLNQDCVL